MAKCVLAFTGSLDSLLAIPWIKEHHDMDVVALSVDLGDGEELYKSGSQGGGGRSGRQR